MRLKSWRASVRDTDSLAWEPPLPTTHLRVLRRDCQL